MFWGVPTKKEMSKTISMDYSEYQEMETKKKDLEIQVKSAHTFQNQLEELLLSSKEKEIKGRNPALDPLDLPKSEVYTPLTRSQILERVELMVHKFAASEYEAAVKKWEKKLA
jgi:hypothetical protein